MTLSSGLLYYTPNISSVYVCFDGYARLGQGRSFVGAGLQPERLVFPSPKDLSLFRDRAIIAAFSFFHSLKFVSTRESVFSNTTALSGESWQFVFNDPHRRIKLALSSAVESRNRSLSRYIITIHANDCVFNVE